MELRVSSPCPVTWESLKGDHLVRYCGRCKLNVYNFAEMSRDEVERIVRKTEGRLCGQLYLRGDRTGTAQNCPAGRMKTLLRRTLSVAALLLLAGVAWICRTSERPDRSGFPLWVRMTLDLLAPETATPPPPRPPRLLGEIACPPPKVPAPPPAPGP